MLFCYEPEDYLDFITVTFKATIKIFFILAIMIGVHWDS